MSAQRHYQRALDLGPESQFDIQHGQHDHSVAIATKPHGWKTLNIHQLCPHEIARRMVLELANTDNNVYLSQCGFGTGGRRTVANVTALTSLYVDLDTYNVPELAGMAPEAILGRIEAAHPWLPPPTMLASSGRGAYLVWVMDKPLPNSRMPDWQPAESALVALLAPFGADQNVKDAARILRVCGSVNTKNGSRVWYKHLHDRVSFADMASALKKHTTKPKPKVVDYFLDDDEPRPVRLAPVSRFFNGYTLAYGRMQDLNRLASMRGQLSDHRHRFLYAFAVAAAWYCPTESALVRELDAFAEKHFVDAHKYRGRKVCGTVIERMKLARQGTKHQWRDDEIDPRYRMQNCTIIRHLDITKAEQVSLSVIIGGGEKARRKAKRNEKRYARRRATYLANMASHTEKQRQAVLELLGQGMSKTLVAKQLGLPRSRIYQLG
jgi:hypothetical protein